MPKVGMEKIRRQQLIDATLESIEIHGLHRTTIATISKIAGVSTGIISHYFGGKSGLIEAAIKYLLFTLRQDFIANLEPGVASHKARLYAIIDANFSVVQKSNKASVTWLSFWAQSMHTESLARIQSVNAKRLVSNLRFSFRQLMPEEQALWSANLMAAQIDGFWLRAALSQESEAYKCAADSCKRLLETLLRDVEDK